MNSGVYEFWSRYNSLQGSEVTTPLQGLCVGAENTQRPSTHRGLGVLQVLGHWQFSEGFWDTQGVSNRDGDFP